MTGATPQIANGEHLSPEIGVAAAQEALAGDGAVKTHFKVLPIAPDPFFGRDGRGPYVLRDTAHAEAVVAATRAHYGDIDPMVDYDHQSMFAVGAGNGGQAKAGGWIKGLTVKSDGIYADVEWTTAAQAALAAKEYRYISPFFIVDKVTRAVKRLVNIGLVNQPNLELAAVAAEQLTMTGESMTLAKIAAALGLAANVDEDAVVAAVEALKTKTATNPLEPVAAAIGLPATASAEEIVTAATSLKAGAGNPDPTQFVPKAGYDALAATVKRLDEERVTAAVDAAVAAGKVAPAMRPWALELAAKDEASFNSFVATATPFAGGETVAKGTPKAKATSLTEEEIAACEMTGTSHEAYLAAKNLEIAA